MLAIQKKQVLVLEQAEWFLRVFQDPAEPGQNSQESPTQNKLDKPPGTKTVTGEAPPPRLTCLSKNAVNKAVLPPPVPYSHCFHQAGTQETSLLPLGQPMQLNKSGKMSQ